MSSGGAAGNPSQATPAGPAAALGESLLRAGQDYLAEQCTWRVACGVAYAAGTAAYEVFVADALEGVDEFLEGNYGGAVMAAGVFLFKPAKVLKELYKGAVEMHHLLPQAKRFSRFFERAGLNIEDFKIPLDRATHRLKPGGVHTKAGGDWNGVWDKFFEQNPRATKDQILQQLERMRKDFGI